MALPSIAKLMDWDLPTMSQNLSEEEVKIKRMSEEQLHSEPLQIQKYTGITTSIKHLSYTMTTSVQILSYDIFSSSGGIRHFHSFYTKFFIQINFSFY